MILLLDNYDSFTHNLYQYMSEITTEPIEVIRNDAVTLDQVAAMQPGRIVISPGPGRPEEAGISVGLIRRFAGKIPILGVCLGHQAIGYAYGASIVQARNIVHGKVEPIDLDGRGLFRSIDSPAEFTRYHSLVIDEQTLPAELEITARSSDGEIMGVRHRDYLLEGVQFHPESIASQSGKKLLANFLHYLREPFVARTVLTRVLGGEAMGRQEAANFMEEVTEGNLTAAQIAGFLVAINARGISAEEIAGCASVLQRKRVPVTTDRAVLDTCGTGGDGLGTFNISSMAALVAAACGATVAKHGNRAVSSRSGSADFYRELGIPIDLSREEAEQLIAEHGFAFLFAPLYHGAMKHAAVPRRELGIKTIFNLLGPLVNPAGAQYQIIGVYDRAFCRPVAEAAVALGTQRGMVVHGLDGIDELSVSAPSAVVRFDSRGITDEQELDPVSLGISGHTLQDLSGGDADANAALARELLSGGGRPAIRDSVLLNAAAALEVYGVADSIAAGLALAREALSSGAVAAKVDAIIAAGRGSEPAAPAQTGPAAPPAEGQAADKRSAS
ncbi:MAG: bifunctional anthranilate synthase component II/anthranilate phosphoribosyltransferase [Spirochaetaceae bacterium]|nr:MAG: bifunctional anthranilate synthase component II/anthranilate phosphoribosyltransferase [Spirochaetaceae bacterium]